MSPKNSIYLLFPHKDYGSEQNAVLAMVPGCLGGNPRRLPDMEAPYATRRALPRRRGRRKAAPRVGWALLPLRTPSTIRFVDHFDGPRHAFRRIKISTKIEDAVG
jgi:hypothetical protein